VVDAPLHCLEPTLTWRPAPLKTMDELKFAHFFDMIEFKRLEHEAKMRLIEAAAQLYSFTPDQLGRLLESQPYADVRERICVACFSNITSRREFCRIVRKQLQSVRKGLRRRLGVWNLFDPSHASEYWALNLKNTDERQLAELLLSMCDPGEGEEPVPRAIWDMIELEEKQGEPKMIKKVPDEWTEGEMPIKGMLKFSHCARKEPEEDEEEEVAGTNVEPELEIQLSKEAGTQAEEDIQFFEDVAKQAFGQLRAASASHTMFVDDMMDYTWKKFVLVDNKSPLAKINRTHL